MKRVTLNAIAEKAGVSSMTVSLALRNQGRISKAKREQILRWAERLGYRPDPALSALNAYRDERRTTPDYTTLVFLTNFRTENYWRNQTFARLYFEGAVERASKLGYRVEPFWLGQPRLTSARVAQIFETRGIKGILLAPISQTRREVTLDWNKFCAVSLCRSLTFPPINVVDHNHHQSMTLTWKELRSRGYFRIGYVVTENTEMMTERLWLATYLMEQERAQPREAKIPALVTSEWRRGVFESWFRENRPDVIISPHIEPYRWMREIISKRSDEVGFTSLEADPAGDISGVSQQFRNVGVLGVDLLHADLIHGAYGPPKTRHSVAVDGVWVEGRTLRPRIST